MIRLAPIVLLGCACATAHPSARGQVETGTPDAVNIVKAREAHQAQRFSWQPWSRETFERAKRERKPLLVDCAAEWCHWCHVMDETTYRDPAVGELLASRFIPVRVDVDQRPDLEERYGAWGWPATVLLSPDAMELGKLRGYVTRDELLKVLGTLDPEHPEALEAAPKGIDVAQLDGAVKHALERLDFFWDEQQGSWGLRRKVPIGMNVQFLARRALRGDGEAKRQALRTLDLEAQILDPVWGGIYQYSVAEDWSEPHFEKLATFQADNLSAYVAGLALRDDPATRARADEFVAYLAQFLTAPDGTFYVNQDADLNAHAHELPFVDGHTYYRLDDAHRRALGIPWVDTHVYARENGLLIRALLAHHLQTGAKDSLDRALKAANRIVETHLLRDGAVKHEATSKGAFYLADAASLGLAFVSLGEVTHDPAWLARARSIADQMRVVFKRADASSALADNTADPDAQGVFAVQRSSFENQVLVARLFAALGLRDEGRRVLASVSSDAALDEEGPWVGEWLIAASELGYESALR